jgi:hypothetical protein
VGLLRGALIRAVGTASRYEEVGKMKFALPPSYFVLKRC